LRRVTGLIELGTLIVNSMIGLRFLLKLMAANPENAFAQLVYFFAAPFLAIFVGLTRTPSFEGIVIEFYDSIAIMVYFVLAWVVIRLMWVLFARVK
jgi:YggT family protein